jgi:hypothetical protein
MIVHLSHFSFISEDEGSALRATANGAKNCRDLDEVESMLRALWPNWFVYRGGHHVSMHIENGHPARILLVCEEGGEDKIGITPPELSVMPGSVLTY